MDSLGSMTSNLEEQKNSSTLNCWAHHKKLGPAKRTHKQREPERPTDTPNMKETTSESMSLNNLGVSLMQRGDYHGAMEAFQQALMPFTSLPLNGAADSSPTTSKRTRKMVAKTRSNVNRTSNRGTVLAIVYNDEDMEAAAHDLSSSSTIGTAVWLSDNGNTSKYLPCEVAAIVCFNYATAYHLTQASPHLRTAFNLLRSAHDLLCEESSHVCLRMLVACHLMGLSLELSRPDLSHRYYDLLCQLREEIPVRHHRRNRGDRNLRVRKQVLVERRLNAAPTH